MRKIVVNAGVETAEFADAEDNSSGKHGFVRFEFHSDDVGTLTVYERIANEHVDLTRNVASFAPGQWISVKEVKA